MTPEPATPPRDNSLRVYIAGAALILTVITPRLFIYSADTQLISQVPRGFLEKVVLGGFVLSQTLFWLLFGQGRFAVGQKRYVPLFVLLGLMFSIPIMMMSAVFSSQIYSFCIFDGVQATESHKLYVISDTSDRGRGGTRAQLAPYGLGDVSLPLSMAQFRQYSSVLPHGILFCYPVVEQRVFGAIRIVKPNTMKGAEPGLVECAANDPKIVTNLTDPRITRPTK